MFVVIFVLFSVVIGVPVVALTYAIQAVAGRPARARARRAAELRRLRELGLITAKTYELRMHELITPSVPSARAESAPRQPLQ